MGTLQMAPVFNAAFPDFERPPVIEVVIGAQFAPLDGFLPTHPGLFWDSMRDAYPKVEVAPPLAPVVESRGFPSFDESSQIEFATVVPLPRVFFIDGTTGSWLVQLQRDRLLQNWRKVAPTEDYPRFPAVRERFRQLLDRFRAFCNANVLGEPVINQLEVTYINHIALGEGWTAAKDIGLVFPDVVWRGDHEFLPPPEVIAWRSSFALPDEQGRLRVSIRQAKRKVDGVDVLLCELTARGLPLRRDADATFAWVDMAREWIVRGFVDLTSADVQSAYWRRSR
jgi:uncharacterized protein (TIGR04255 family)